MPCARHANSVLSVLCLGSGFSAHVPVALSLAGHLTGDGPDEAGQFPGRGSGDPAFRLAGLVQVTIPGAKPFLCCPGPPPGAAPPEPHRHIPGTPPAGPGPRDAGSQASENAPASTGIVRNTPARGEEGMPQALAGLQLHRLHVLAGSALVPRCLLLFARNAHRAQVPRPMQTRQLRRITPIRLHPLPGGTRNPARRHNHAVMAGLHDLAIDPVSARTRLMAKPDHLSVRAHYSDQPTQRRPGVRHYPPGHRFLTSRPGNRYRNRVLVDPNRHTHCIPTRPVLLDVRSDLVRSRSPGLEHNPRSQGQDWSIHIVLAFCRRLSPHSWAIDRAFDAERREDAHSSGLPVPFMPC